MSLSQYFENLIKCVEESEDIHNGGKDKNGFYKPTRTIVLRNLQLLKDLNEKPLARPMLKAAWQAVVEELPSEWLILKPKEKEDLKKMLSES